mmetsp:Transcript_18449/g.41735  ORF Transcript_18449/g.41735 Transcript_18449/m.41735 type:complete len:233 (-) Transcript_18449:60-758(-)
MAAIFFIPFAMNGLVSTLPSLMRSCICPPVKWTCCVSNGIISPGFVNWPLWPIAPAPGELTPMPRLRISTPWAERREVQPISGTSTRTRRPWRSATRTCSPNGSSPTRSESRDCPLRTMALCSAVYQPRSSSPMCSCPFTTAVILLAKLPARGPSAKRPTASPVAATGSRGWMCAWTRQSDTRRATPANAAARIEVRKMSLTGRASAEAIVSGPMWSSSSSSLSGTSDGLRT